MSILIFAAAPRKSDEMKSKADFDEERRHHQAVMHILLHRIVASKSTDPSKNALQERFLRALREEGITESNK